MRAARTVAFGDMEFQTESEPLPATGEPRVDAALRSLASLGDLPAAEHPQLFERVHGQLVEVLGELHGGSDSAQGS